MKFAPITLNDKPIFKKYLSGRYHRLITYNFSTFYMCRDWDPYGWCIVNDALVLKSDYLGLDTIICPISPDDEKIFAATETAIDWYTQRNTDFIMSEVDEDMLACFEQRWPGRFRAEEYPDGFNYIYKTSDLATLHGKRFHAKRNHLNRFFKEHPDYRFVPLTPDLIPRCLNALDKWCLNKDEQTPEIINETCGVRDALNNISRLDCCGAAILLGSQVIAFTLGEPLNEDTFCIHVEKADININGSYQAINLLFARNFCQGYRYINRAEDMGHPGLRQAKQSYHPCRMEKKYYLRLT